jgi:hypothetical protein
MTLRMQWVVGIAFLVLISPPRSDGEVLIVQPNGERLIGETIGPASNGVHAVMLYRGYNIQVPAAAVASVWKFDLSRADDRAVFSNRLAALKP